MHADAVGDGTAVVIVDDLLATGGTAAATVELIREQGARVAGVAVVVELELLKGRARLDGIPVDSLLTY
jgi:adenine phosphoribosyltransferase